MSYQMRNTYHVYREKTSPYTTCSSKRVSTDHYPKGSHSHVHCTRRSCASDLQKKTLNKLAYMLKRMPPLPIYPKKGKLKGLSSEM